VPGRRSWLGGDRPVLTISSAKVALARRLARIEASGEADWDAVVWFDDVPGPGARESAHAHDQLVLRASRVTPADAGNGVLLL
jgi:hypothetical protein